MWCAHLRSFALICAQSRTHCAPTALFLRSNCEHLERKKSAVGRSGSALRPYCAHTAPILRSERKMGAKRAQKERSWAQLSAVWALTTAPMLKSMVCRSMGAVRAQWERDWPRWGRNRSAIFALRLKLILPKRGRLRGIIILQHRADSGIFFIIPRFPIFSVLLLARFNCAMYRYERDLRCWIVRLIALKNTRFCTFATLHIIIF